MKYKTALNGRNYYHGGADNLVIITPAPTGTPDGSVHLALRVPVPLQLIPPMAREVGRTCHIDTNALAWLAGGMTPADGERPELEGIRVGKFDIVSSRYGKTLRAVFTLAMQSPDAVLPPALVDAFLSQPITAPRVTIEVGKGWCALHDPATHRSIYAPQHGNAWPDCSRLLTHRYDKSRPYPCPMADLDINPQRLEGAPSGTLHYSHRDAYATIKSEDGSRALMVAMGGEDEV